MITTTINGVTWKFEWEQYPSAKATLCKVINITKNQECKKSTKNECVTAAAVAYCGDKDTYSRKVGAKISFEKVLKILTKDQSKIDKKEFRTAAWQAFFERKDTGPSITNDITE